VVIAMVVVAFAFLIAVVTASPERRAELLFWLP
jgi:hypothetical protein